MPTMELTSEGLEELRALSYQEMQPIERLKQLSLGLPRYFEELKQILGKHENSIRKLQEVTDYFPRKKLEEEISEQKRLFLAIIDKIIEILEIDHSDLIDVQNIDIKQGHKLKAELRPSGNIISMVSAWLSHRDEKRHLAKAIGHVCALLDILHKLRQEMIAEPNYLPSAKKIVSDMEKIMSLANRFFKKEQKDIGLIEHYHARVREMLKPIQ